MERDLLIERLISDRVEQLGIGQHTHRFLQVVEREFRDFGKMSDAQLARELARRGLTFAADSAPEPADYAEDDEQDDSDTRFLMREWRVADEDWAPGYG